MSIENYGKVLTWDTETLGFEWHSGQTAFLFQIGDADGESAYDLADKGAAKEALARLCAADCLVAHNAKFDVHQTRETPALSYNLLEWWHGSPFVDGGGETVFRDTEVMARVLWPEAEYGEHNGFSLTSLAQAFIDPDADRFEKVIHERARQIGYTRLKNQPGMYYDVYRAYPDDMLAYAKSDVRYTYDIFELLCKAEDEATDGQREVIETEHKVLPILIRAEKRGVALNEKGVAKLHKTYKKKEIDDKEALRGYGMPEACLGGEGSEAALEEFLLKQGVPLYKRTDGGKLSTSKGALEEFQNEHPFVKDFLEYRTTEKFLSTYIEPMLGKSVIHTSFSPIGTWTGRMACRSPNMQNIPIRGGNEIRQVMVPRPGYVFVVNDYDNIEMRILAYYLGVEGQPFRDLINGGLDCHAWIAAKLAAAGAPSFAGFSLDMNDYLKGTDGAALRARAKNSATFPTIYGAGGAKLCLLNGLPTGPALKAGDWEVRNGIRPEGHPSYAEGKALSKAIKASIPGYNSLLRRVKRAVENRGYVTTFDGRKQALARDKGYVGMSALIQGSAAGAMKKGIIEAAKDLRPYDAELVLFVHDEAVAEARIDQAEEVQHVMQAAMERCMPEEFDPPLLVSGTICETYGEAK